MVLKCRNDDENITKLFDKVYDQAYRTLIVLFFHKIHYHPLPLKNEILMVMKKCEGKQLFEAKSATTMRMT